ncbi:MAG: hypothetical protein CM1200mP6_08320 [Anaerolineaceae bacterium]|nr:MAG: hypothetical protein CM1200mP6_08320 [Anaerolineaceae bacterium]
MEVITLDLRFRNVPEALASFLVLCPSGPVLIETGPGSTVLVCRKHYLRMGCQLKISSTY